MGKIISYFENYDPSDEVALNFAYCYAAALSVCTLVLAIMHHLYFYHVQRAGMKLRVAMCHMIYRKVSKPVSRYIWHLTAVSLEEFKNTVVTFMLAIPSKLLICRNEMHANMCHTLNVCMCFCSLFGNMVSE